MKHTIVIALLLMCGVCAAQNENKKPELKLSSEPSAAPNTNTPELKAADPSTAKKQKDTNQQPALPELKSISKPNEQE